MKMMKNLFIGLAASTILLFTACNSGSDKKADTNEGMDHACMQDSMNMHEGMDMHDSANMHEIMNMNGDSMSVKKTVGEAPAGLGTVVDAYLRIKDALVSDNGEGAATGGKALSAALKGFDKASLTKNKLAVFNDVFSSANEHAEHIASNARDIKHQREHFQDLSNDIYDLVKAAGVPQTIYKEYCPMMKASWLSESSEIKNPYYGGKSDMASCGEIRETLTK